MTNAAQGANDRGSLQNINMWTSADQRLMSIDPYGYRHTDTFQSPDLTQLVEGRAYDRALAEQWARAEMHRQPGITVGSNFFRQANELIAQQAVIQGTTAATDPVQDVPVTATYPSLTCKEFKELSNNLYNKAKAKHESKTVLPNL